MNSLLEYQLKCIGYTSTLTESQLLTLIQLVNETYNTSDKNRAYQRKMLDITTNKIQTLHP